MPSRNEELPLAVEIQQTEQPLRIYDGLVEAMRDLRVVLDAVLEVEDADAARTALRARLGLDELQAQAVLNMQFRRATKLDSHKIEDRRNEIGSHLEFLRQLQNRVTSIATAERQQPGGRAAAGRATDATRPGTAVCECGANSKPGHPSRGQRTVR